MPKPRNTASLYQLAARARQIEANNADAYAAHQAELDHDGRIDVIVARFNELALSAPTELIEMWLGQHNENGRRLTPDERRILRGTIKQALGAFPPDPTPEDKAAGFQGTGQGTVFEGTEQRLEDHQSDTMLSVDEVVRLAGVSSTWLWRASRKGIGPRRYKLPTRHVGYKAGDVLDWIKSLAVDPRKPLADRRTTPHLRRT